MKRRRAKSDFLFPEMTLGADNPWLTKRSTTARSTKPNHEVSVLELCAGAGGQALGFEWAGHNHVALLELDKNACASLKLNRPDWQIIQGDLNSFDAFPIQGRRSGFGRSALPSFFDRWQAIRASG